MLAVMISDAPISKYAVLMCRNSVYMAKWLQWKFVYLHAFSFDVANDNPPVLSFYQEFEMTFGGAQIPRECKLFNLRDGIVVYSKWNEFEALKSRKKLERDQIS